mgnify:CR=1 FL=1
MQAKHKHAKTSVVSLIAVMMLSGCTPPTKPAKAFAPVKHPELADISDQEFCWNWTHAQMTGEMLLEYKYYDELNRRGLRVADCGESKRPKPMFTDAQVKGASDTADTALQIWDVIQDIKFIGGM